jgi:CheY-like chemotaxis protein
MASVLIVEDETIVALDLRRRLTRLGYDVAGVTAYGEEAIVLAEQQRPDLVLMDVRLRGTMDGVTAAEQIHARFGSPVVFVTAYADEETFGRAGRSEPFGYLLKPFEEEELRKVVESALTRGHPQGSADRKT